MSSVDRPGIVAAVSAFLRDRGANVVELAQHSTDPIGGSFVQRTEFLLDALPAHVDRLRAEFEAEVAARFDASFTLVESRTRKRVAILASKADHCLADLLWRARRGDLPIDVAIVVANHPDLAHVARTFGVPFVHVPVPADGKEAAEQRLLELLDGNVDLVVLARYMQVLSAGLLDALGCPVINIHHSFLPAFVGQHPYAKAKRRGVKLIGATAHYVTEALDEGPIIEQDVVRVSHRDSATELARRGADVERLVLARAVRWHAEDRVVRADDATVVL